MRFYREKILLSLLELLPSSVTKVQFQKLMFLLCDKQMERAYDFMPYLYGCYSMRLSNDLKRLEAEGYVTRDDDSRIAISRKDLCISQLLNSDDATTVYKIAHRYGEMSMADLIRYTYINYPFFAINSQIADKYLDENQLKVIEKYRPQYKDRALFTIGYEGLSLESYIVMLIRNDIKVLCDVRKNAYSQKFGFSKALLQKACEGVGIKYEHIPQLGIISEKRKALNSQEDYDLLFDDYEATVLETERESLNHIFLLLQNNHRVALTCFEHNFKQCHRSRIAKKLVSIKQCNYTLTNI